LVIVVVAVAIVRLWTCILLLTICLVVVVSMILIRVSVRIGAIVGIAEDSISCIRIESCDWVIAAVARLRDRIFRAKFRLFGGLGENHSLVLFEKMRFQRFRILRGERATRKAGHSGLMQECLVDLIRKRQLQTRKSDDKMTRRS
jgi:hypothetical protein